MNAEEILASKLERRISSLPIGRRVRVMLDESIVDPTTHQPRPGPHVAGYVERADPGELQIKLVDTEGGRTARGLLEAELLDVTLGGYPPSIRLAADSREAARPGRARR